MLSVAMALPRTVVVRDTTEYQVTVNVASCRVSRIPTAAKQPAATTRGNQTATLSNNAPQTAPTTRATTAAARRTVAPRLLPSETRRARVEVTTTVATSGTPTCRAATACAPIPAARTAVITA